VSGNHLIPILILFIFVFLFQLCKDGTVMDSGKSVEIYDQNSRKDPIHCRPALHGILTVLNAEFEFSKCYNRNTYVLAKM